MVAGLAVFIYTARMEPETPSKPCLNLTGAAVAEARRLLGRESEPAGKVLRVYVESGGCSGMQYGLVFDEQRDGDETMRFEDVPVVVDSFSADYLRGSLVDFSDDLNDSGFKVTNPNAKTTCGCGKSFEN